MKRSLILIFSFLLLSIPVLASSTEQAAEPAVLAIDKAFHLRVLASDNQKNLIAHWTIAPEHYLYQSSIKITANNTDITPTLPTAKTYESDAIYANTLILHIPIYTPSTITVHYQGCTTWGFCYPPETKKFKLNTRHHTLVISPIIENAVNTQSPDLFNNLINFNNINFNNINILFIMGIFYLAGLLLAFTPCMLPMLPILGAIIATEDHLNTKKGFLLSLVYVLSMACTYAIAGILAASLGQTAQSWFQQPWIIALFSALFVLLALVQLEKIHFRLPFNLNHTLHHFQRRLRGGHLIEAALMGILATLIASPCVSAPLIGALSYIAQTGDKALGALYLWMLGLGMGTPLLILGALGAKYIPKAGIWMKRVNQFFAVVLLGLAVWLLTRILPASIIIALWGLLAIFASVLMGTFHLHKPGYMPRIGVLVFTYGFVLILGAGLGYNTLLYFLNISQSQLANASVHNTVHNLPELYSALQIAQEEHKPVLLDVYADWCTTCKKMETTIFANPEVLKNLASWRIIRVDITQQNTPDVHALMQEWGILAPPVFIFFDTTGQEWKDSRLTGTVEPATLIRHIQRLAP